MGLPKRLNVVEVAASAPENKIKPARRKAVAMYCNMLYLLPRRIMPNTITGMGLDD